MIQLHDAVSGVAIAVLGAVVFWAARQLPAIPGQQIGPGLMPTLLGAGLLVCGAMLVRRAARARSAGPRPWLSFDRLDRRGLACVAAIPAACLAYIALVDALGFVPTAALILLLLQRLLRVRWGLAALVAIGGAATFHAAFVTLLRVPLPSGLLAPLVG